MVQNHYLSNVAHPGLRGEEWSKGPKGYRVWHFFCENNVNNYLNHQKFGNLKYLIKKAFLGTLGNPRDTLFSVV